MKISVDLDRDQRIETGVLQINEDWPGIFIRGDNAFGYAMEIKMILNSKDDIDPFIKINLENLYNLLMSCVEG